jgi:hypothetical protein
MLGRRKKSRKVNLQTLLTTDLKEAEWLASHSSNFLTTPPPPRKYPHANLLGDCLGFRTVMDVVVKRKSQCVRNQTSAIQSLYWIATPPLLVHYMLPKYETAVSFKYHSNSNQMNPRQQPIARMLHGLIWRASWAQVQTASLSGWNPKKSDAIYTKDNTKKKNCGFESASKLYRSSNRRRSARLVSTLADRGCHVVPPIITSIF